MLDKLYLRIGGLIRNLHRRWVRLENRVHLAQISRKGHGVGIWGPVTITGHDRITLGANVHIGGGAFIRAEGGLEIGDNTHISRNLLLYTINHRYEGARVPYDDEQVGKPVRIGRNVWVGMNVCIAPGTTIGDGAIIGMGAVLSGEIPPLAIVGSPRWRVIGERDRERYERLDRERAYGGPDGVRYEPPGTDAG